MWELINNMQKSFKSNSNYNKIWIFAMCPAFFL